MEASLLNLYLKKGRIGEFEKEVEFMSTTQTKYFVDKLKCDGCVESCKKALVNVPGFESAEFDFQAGTGIVTGDVDPQAVCLALSSAGYPAVVNSGS
jgi:copper chaperone CopZ